MHPVSGPDREETIEREQLHNRLEQRLAQRHSFVSQKSFAFETLMLNL